MRAFGLSATLVVLATAYGLRCTSRAQSSENQSFEFSSGGAYHPQGFGEWQVKVDIAGTLSITHNVGGKVRQYGTHTLTEQENVALWGLIRGADIKSLESSQRLGLPDEVQYTFALKDQTRTQAAEIWIGDARKNDKIVALVDSISALIKAYTRQKPTL